MIKSLLLLLGSCVLLAACNHASYQQDYKSGTDFSQLKTYSWRSTDVKLPGISGEELQGLIDEQLQSKGYQKQQSGGDMLLDLEGFARVSKSSISGFGMSTGVGLTTRNDTNVALGVGRVAGRMADEGILVLDITRTADNALVWRGNAMGLTLSDYKLSTETQLRDTIVKLISPLPSH